jgi:hypothetical protein
VRPIPFGRTCRRPKKFGPVSVPQLSNVLAANSQRAGRSYTGNHEEHYHVPAATREVYQPEHEHGPAAPRARHQAREGLPDVPRSRRDGQVAASERLYVQGGSLGCQGGRHVQDVVHELHDRRGPLVRRRIPRARAARAYLLHGSVL